MEAGVPPANIDMAPQLVLALTPPASEEVGGVAAALTGRAVDGVGPPCWILPDTPDEEGRVGILASLADIICCRRGRSSRETGSLLARGCWLEAELAGAVVGEGAEDAAARKGSTEHLMEF